MPLDTYVHRTRFRLYIMNKTGTNVTKAFSVGLQSIAVMEQYTGHSQLISYKHVLCSLLCTSTFFASVPSWKGEKA